MNHQIHNKIVSFIWNVADDVLRDVYSRGKYRDVILPMTVIRRLDCLLEDKKDEVLAMKKTLDEAGIVNQDGSLRKVAGQAFYNTSRFTLKTLMDNPKQLLANFRDYLDGFSPNVQEIVEKFDFRNQLQKLDNADALGHLIQKFVDPEINLSPNPVFEGNGKVKLPGLDNHDMGSIFEELIRRFNEENNEEAGEHWTPRDVVRLMAHLVFLPVADLIQDSTYLVYDPACGTGGMLTVAEEVLADLSKKEGKKARIHLYGQEINAETYAICKADLLLKGQGRQADHIRFGSTLSSDAFTSDEFHFMLANPPFGKSWKTDLDRLCGGNKKDMLDPRFVVSHDGDDEFSLVSRSSDGQLMFLVNMLSKMKPPEHTPFGSRLAIVHNGSSLFTGDAGQGESNIRRWIIENDWLEAIIALPLHMFYNTGIASYVWVLTNKKPEHRRGKVQLINAAEWFVKLQKNLGQKNCRLSQKHIGQICDAFLKFEETEHSKIFPNETFGYWKITVERPLRLNSRFTPDRLEKLRFVPSLAQFMEPLFKRYGERIYQDFENVRPKIEAFLDNLPKPPAGRQKSLLLRIDTWNKQLELHSAGEKIAKLVGDGLFSDYNLFDKKVAKACKENGFEISATNRKTICRTVSQADPDAEPVVLKKHKGGAVEYEPDPALRDTEQVPLLWEGGIGNFFDGELLPHVPDAWIDQPKTIIGYEIPFVRSFYKHVKLRSLEEIKNDIFRIDKETEGLLEKLFRN